MVQACATWSTIASTAGWFRSTHAQLFVQRPGLVAAVSARRAARRRPPNGRAILDAAQGPAGAVRLYESLLAAAPQDEERATAWSRARRRIEAEWTLWSNLAQAASRCAEPEATIAESMRS